MRVHFIAAGWADAILIETPGMDPILIDAGDEASGRRLKAYLRKRKIRRLHTAVITHPHRNHFGGFRAISESVPVAGVWINGDTRAEEGYSELLEKWKSINTPVEVVGEGRTLFFPELSFKMEILHPSQLRGSVNANSLVVWLEYGRTSILLTGDIEEREQTALLERHEKVRAADCVQVPHHGGPLSEEFVHAFSKAVFVVSTGLNPWKLPRPEDLHRIPGKVYRTDRSGTIVIESDGNTVRVIP